MSNTISRRPLSPAAVLSGAGTIGLYTAAGIGVGAVGGAIVGASTTAAGTFGFGTLGGLVMGGIAGAAIGGGVGLGAGVYRVAQPKLNWHTDSFEPARTR
ncbi:MAG: hypothetical protein AB1938_05215 [Myxococcota bacterium]